MSDGITNFVWNGFLLNALFLFAGAIIFLIEDNFLPLLFAWLGFIFHLLFSFALIKIFHNEMVVN